MTRPRRAAAAVAAAVVAVPLALSLGHADAMPAPERAAADSETTDPTFTRHDIDTGITGAAFTTVGPVFKGEQDIITSGWGTFDGSRPTGPGSLFLFRPGATLDDWTKITVFGPEAGITMPNATTVIDVDKDGDKDIVVPSGHFFGTDTKLPAEQQLLSGSITWWENRGPAKAFKRHDIIVNQPGAYHGVTLADLDGDGVRDLVSVSEEARVADVPTDDTITTQFFKGRKNGTFAAPVALSDVGGSQPVIADVDGDGDLDIASSRYFDNMRGAGGGVMPAPTFLWLENRDRDGKLKAADFTTRTIATMSEVGRGFQIRPVLNFRKRGKVSWVGTNHNNRCTWSLLLPPWNQKEAVMEFVPGDNIREPWTVKVLSDPETPPPPCPADYGTNRDNYPTFSDAITSRYHPGQGAPGVLGYGDVDGDGDVDLAVAGDGDRRLWWIEKNADGSTTLHQLTQDGEYFGQSGGSAVVDFNGDGVNELVFSSWDQNTLALWTPTGTVDAQ